MGSIAWTPLPLLMLLILFAAANSSVTVKRTSNDLPHPTTMELELILPDSNKKLLVPFSRITAFENIPMTVLDNGLSRSFSSNQVRHPSHSHYRDLDSGSVISVRHVNGNRVMSGHVMHDEILYSLEPIGEFNHRIVKSERSSADRSEKVMSKKLRNVVSRRRRQVNQSPTEYVVELHLLLDHTVWQTMNNIHISDTKTLTELYFYYSHILNGIDTVYRNIRAFSISVSCVGITIAKTPSDSKWVPENHNNNGSVILDGVASYVNLSKKFDEDHVMAFTRIDCIGIAGMAFSRPGICHESYKSSLVLDLGLHSWIVAAHELAHNLGAINHDGKENECPRTFGVMAPGVPMYSPSNVHQSYLLSNCAVRQIARVLYELNFYDENCLLINKKPRQPELTADVREGARLSLEDVCRLSFPSLKAKLFPTFEYGTEGQCAQIGCTDYYGRTHSLEGLRAPVGAVCGNGKSCNWNGECTWDANAPVQPEDHFDPFDPFKPVDSKRT